MVKLVGRPEWQRHLKRLSYEGGPRKKSTDTVVGPGGHLLWASAPPSGCRLQKATRMKWGKREDSKPFFVPVWVSGCRLVVLFGAALFVVSGVSVFPFVCALLHRLFFGRHFSCLFLSCTAARALLRSPQQEPCVWCGTHRVQKPAIRGQVPPAGKLDCGDAATSRSLWAWYAPIFLLFLLLSYPWFYAGNSTRFLKSISTGVHERLRQLDREHSWDCMWCKVGGWTPTFTNGLNCVWSTSAVGPRRSLTSDCHCWTVNTVWDCVSCNVGGWTPAFENFVQVVVVVLGLRVFASEACSTLGSHSSMVKLVVSL